MRNVQCKGRSQKELNQFFKPTVLESQKYSVHFEYNDLCCRLKDIQKNQQLNSKWLPTAVKYFTRIQQLNDSSPLTSQSHSLIKSFEDSKQIRAL